ncbi:ATP-binding protein [Comamonadaceae bacterium OH2545_COT-014]|nr:ATP-binding protein [Comamonadaceae bacterium OH2545_COT-014]
MGLSLVQGRALMGLAAPAVAVEVHLANGLPGFTLVGLADVEVKEARERVRSALQNSGLAFPHSQRITVNLAPADLPKDSGRFDLPIALGILAASGQIDGARLAGWEFAGELSLSGELRPVRGALATAVALHQAGNRARLVLPPGSAEEAALVPGMAVYRARHLLDVVAQFLPQGAAAPEATTAVAPAMPDTADGWARLPPTPPAAAPHYPDLADVKGQAAARRALEIAAAGGHSLLMVGPPGTGKSMLAQRFAGLLPPMPVAAALQSAAVASLAGRFTLAQWGQRPTRAPHHSASAVALVGGGSPPRPGEISLAHEGVLFLDELPEFPRAALEALREPLESGHITISRAAQRAEFPARFQLVAAMNPCPCGYLGSTQRACRCTPDQVARYQGKLSGPLLDRIDLHVEVAALPAAELLAAPPGEPSAAVRQRCTAARERALARQGVPNQQLAGQPLQDHLHLTTGAAAFIQRAAERLAWSARATHRALKVARTIADLAASDAVDTPHVAEAVQYRRALRGGAG